MTDTKTGFQNRREFFRLKFTTPLRFKSYAVKNSATVLPQTDAEGRSRNVSQSGILFQTENAPPQISSILWLNLDIRTLKICQEIEDRVLIFNNGLLGRVVRVEEESRSGSYDIGVCFLTQEQKNSREVQKVLTEISKTA